jgi:hypothetical protein
MGYAPDEEGGEGGEVGFGDCGHGFVWLVWVLSEVVGVVCSVNGVIVMLVVVLFFGLVGDG